MGIFFVVSAEGFKDEERRWRRRAVKVDLTRINP